MVNKDKARVKIDHTFSSNRPAPECEAEDKSKARKTRRIIIKDADVPVQHQVDFIASANPPRKDFIEKVRERAREVANLNEGQSQKKHHEDERGKIPKRSGEAAESKGEGNTTSTSSSVTASQPLTWQQLKDWARKKVLEGQAEAKKQRRAIDISLQKAERVWESNSGSSEGYG